MATKQTHVPAEEPEMDDETRMVNDQLERMMKLPAAQKLLSMYLDKILLVSVAHGVMSNIDYNKPSVSSESVARFIKEVVANLRLP